MRRATSRSEAVILVVRWLAYGGVLGACLMGPACDGSREVPAPTQVQPQVNTAALEPPSPTRPLALDWVFLLAAVALILLSIAIEFF
jgi:hypothetical protein